jgi:hypothetical protein
MTAPVTLPIRFVQGLIFDGNVRGVPNDGVILMAEDGSQRFGIFGVVDVPEGVGADESWLQPLGG